MIMMNFKQYMVETRRSNKKYDYSSLLIELPDLITDDVICWGFDNVSNDSLFLDLNDTSFGREDDPHITLIYGIHTENLKEVSDLFDDEKEFECKLGKLDLFTKNDKFDVLIASVDCEDLHRLNSKMRKYLEATESYPVYVPHVTICYLRKGQGKKYIDNDAFVGQKFNINKVLFSSKNGVKTPIELGSI